MGVAAGFAAGAAARDNSRRTNLAFKMLAEQEEQRTQRETDAGKAAEFFFKANPEALTNVGMTPEQFANLSAREQSAAAMGSVQAQTQKQIMQQLATANQQQGDDQAALTAFQRAATFNTPTASPSAPGLMPNLNVQTTGEPTRASVWQQLASNPRALRSNVAQPFIRELAQGGGTVDPSTRMNAEANMLNAKANFSRANRATNPGPAVPVRGYTAVPDGNGGYQYLRTQPSATEQLEISRLSERAAGLKLQLAAYEAQLVSGNKRSGLDFMGGKGYADLKTEAQKQLDEINARLSDLKAGGLSGAAGGAPTNAPAGGDDLWQQFMNGQ